MFNRYCIVIFEINLSNIKEICSKWPQIVTKRIKYLAIITVLNAVLEMDAIAKKYSVHVEKNYPV